MTTPASTIVCCVDYRTNMTINHGKASSQPILVKSDHFDNLAPSRPRSKRASECISDSDTGAGVTSDESAEVLFFVSTCVVLIYLQRFLMTGNPDFCHLTT